MGKSGMFARASAGLNLTPGERAVLRLLEGIAASALVAGATAAAPYLAGGTVNWQTVLHVFAAAAVASVLLALNKWSTAQGDPPLPPGGIVQSITIPLMSIGPSPERVIVPPGAPVVPPGAPAQPPAPQAGA